MFNAWNNLSVSKKIYTLVVLSLLILLVELTALRFSVESLNAVRIYMNGESIWSKSQKRAVNMLYLFALTKEPEYYQEFQNSVKKIMAHRNARIELNKENSNTSEVSKQLLMGGSVPSDIPKLIEYYQKYKDTNSIKKIISYWETGDDLMIEIQNLGESIYAQTLRINQKTDQALINSIKSVSLLDQKLTESEILFSSKLQDIARVAEQSFYTVLTIILLISFLRIVLIIYFGKTVKNWLDHYINIATQVSSGDLSKSLNTNIQDEFGKAAEALNNMICSLRSQTNERLSAEHASLSKNIFLANMSHEIRTPLNSILGFSEILRDQNLSVVERETYANIIKRTGASLLSIIQDILDIARIEAEQISIEFSTFSLDQLIIDIKELLSLKAADKGVELTIEKVSNTATYIKSDLTRVRQILLNILGNAIKFTDKGYVKMHYWVEDEQLIFSVKDSGVGIAPDQLNNLFRPFSQGDSSVSKRFGGTGLGLMISKRLAQLLGGDVLFIESHVGVGSTFQVRIRYEPESNLQNIPNLQKKSAPNTETEPNHLLADKKILVVEDSMDNQILINAHLNRYGATVDTADDGKEGLEKCLANNYDLIILDMQMPIMDGYTTSRKIRKNGYTLPILALTGYAMKGDEEKCLAAGCDGYLTKPFSRDDFIRTIARLLTKNLKTHQLTNFNNEGDLNAN